VISREAGNYSTLITLDKGSVHGIKRNMPVLADEGLLGYVVELGLDWCKVSTLTQTSSSIGVYTDRMGVLGVVEGSSELRHDGLCRMTYISNPNVQIGDRVYTGGTGSAYPTGLLIGTISEIRADDATRRLIAVVTPAVDFTQLQNLGKVMLILGYSGR
jgi:rod shape-determining protein MreC